MPPKKRGAADKSPAGEPKRKWKVMTIAEKVKLLDRLKLGMSYASVAREYEVNESTVRYICKEEANIRKTHVMLFNLEAKRVISKDNRSLVKMEKALTLWITDCRAKDVPLTGNLIRAKKGTNFVCEVCLGTMPR